MSPGIVRSNFLASTASAGFLFGGKFPARFFFLGGGRGELEGEIFLLS